MKQTQCEYFQRCEVGREDLCPSRIYNCDEYERLKRWDVIVDIADDYSAIEEQRIAVIRERHKNLMKQRWEER